MADHHTGEHAGEHHPNYRRIYLILLVALVISVAGPFLEIWWITLLTAFGIAVYKAKLVIQNFMHLRWEKKLMRVMLVTSLLLMGLMVAGVAPDVLNHEGNNWVNTAAMDAVERGIDDSHEEETNEGDFLEEEDESGPFDPQVAYLDVCATCHGDAGDGTGPSGAALDPVPADFTDPVFWEGRDDERIFTGIKDGVVAVGGSAQMVAWRFSVNDEEIQALVEYVKGFGPGALDGNE